MIPNRNIIFLRAQRQVLTASVPGLLLGLGLAARQSVPSLPGKPTLGQKTNAPVTTVQGRPTNTPNTAGQATTDMRAETV